MEKNSDYWGRDFLILSLLLGVLLGFGLGTRPLCSADEGRYSEIPREMVASGDYLTPRLNGVKYFEKPPFFYWLQSASIKLFGLSEWSLRLWPAVFALLGCLVVYVAGRELFGRRSGLISSIVLATSPLYYGLGRFITLDMAVSVILGCALVAFLLGTRHPPGQTRRFFMWAFYVFAALATLTKGLIGIVIPGLVIGAWIVLLGEWEILKSIYLPSGLVLYAIIAVPWHVLMSQASPEFARFYFVHEHFQRYLTRGDHGLFRQSWFYIPVVLGGAFPWTVFLVQAVKNNLPSSWRQRHQHRDALFLILWAGLSFLFFSGSSSKVVPYILPLFPPLAILIGSYLSAGWDKADVAGIRLGYWVLLIASLVLVAVGLRVAPHYLERYFDPAKFGSVPYAVSSILLLGPLATLILGLRLDFRRAFILLTLTSVLLIAVANSSLASLNHECSVKDLANVLKSRLQPEDEVATYHTYYQDLPVYLLRRITVAGWKGELGPGMQSEDASSWIVDDTTFWHRWNGSSTIYMLTPRSLYDELRAKPNQKIYLLAGTDRDVLLSNKAPLSTRHGGGG